MLSQFATTLRRTKSGAVEYRGRIALLPVKPMKAARGFLRGIETDVPREPDRDKRGKVA